MKRVLAWTLAVAITMTLAACGKKVPAPQETLPELPAIQQTPPETPENSLAKQEEPSEPEENTGETFSFADVAGLEFYFSSGAGAWRTVLYIHEDGSFEGEYLDSDMGDLDEAAYPNGTRYYNAFFGRFTQPEQVNETTYRTRIETLTCEYPLGEEIRDGFRWIYSEPYGIDGAEELYIYLPGAKLADLPESYRSWVGYYDLTQTEETELPFYGLYNVTEENGFSSYPTPDPAELLQAELAATELLAAEAEKTLQAAMTQTDMNLAAGELYRIWDDMLNIAWMYLKEGLDHEAMQQLTTEQLTWIAEKEAAAAAAGVAYEGGSMQSMAVSLEAAELTRQRVYALAEYLR